MALDAVRYDLEDGVAVVRLDDGKANALSPGLIEAVQGALDRAEKEAGAVLLVGRPGRFSAGFDLATMREGADSARELVRAGAELLLRLFVFPCPVVVACTGHAIAAGALVLLSADVRLGAAGEFKIGLNEVAIGMTLPIFGVELARHRLSKRYFSRAILLAEPYAPEAARDAGFLDRVVGAEELPEAARAEAARLARLPQSAFRSTKRHARGATLEYVRSTLDDDLAKISGPTAR